VSKRRVFLFLNNYIWAFDLSMDDSGIVIFDLEANPVYIGSIKTNYRKSHGERLRCIADGLEELREKYPTQTIIIERGFNRFNTATAVIYRVHGLINYLFADCEQIYYPPKKIKATILKGTATKKQVRDEIKRMYPDVEFSKTEKKDKKSGKIKIEENENESDAFAVGLTYFFLEKGLKVG